MSESTIPRCELHRRSRAVRRALQALLDDARPGSEKAFEYEALLVEAIELLEEAVGRG